MEEKPLEEAWPHGHSQSPFLFGTYLPQASFSAPTEAILRGQRLLIMCLFSSLARQHARSDKLCLLGFSQDAAGFPFQKQIVGLAELSSLLGISKGSLCSRCSATCLARRALRRLPAEQRNLEAAVEAGAEQLSALVQQSLETVAIARSAQHAIAEKLHQLHAFLEPRAEDDRPAAQITETIEKGARPLEPSAHLHGVAPSQQKSNHVGSALLCLSNLFSFTCHVATELAQALEKSEGLAGSLAMKLERVFSIPCTVPENRIRGWSENKSSPVTPYPPPRHPAPNPRNTISRPNRATSRVRPGNALPGNVLTRKERSASPTSNPAGSRSSGRRAQQETLVHRWRPVRLVSRGRSTLPDRVYPKGRRASESPSGSPWARLGNGVSERLLITSPRERRPTERSTSDIGSRSSLPLSRQQQALRELRISNASHAKRRVRSCCTTGCYPRSPLATNTRSPGRPLFWTPGWDGFSSYGRSCSDSPTSTCRRRVRSHSFPYAVTSCSVRNCCMLRQRCPSRAGSLATTVTSEPFRGRFFHSRPDSLHELGRSRRAPHLCSALRRKHRSPSCSPACLSESTELSPQPERRLDCRSSCYEEQARRLWWPRPVMSPVLLASGRPNWLPPLQLPTLSRQPSGPASPKTGGPARPDPNISAEQNGPPQAPVPSPCHSRPRSRATSTKPHATPRPPRRRLDTSKMLVPSNKKKGLHQTLSVPVSPSTTLHPGTTLWQSSSDRGWQLRPCTGSSSKTSFECKSPSVPQVSDPASRCRSVIPVQLSRLGCRNSSLASRITSSEQITAPQQTKEKLGCLDPARLRL